MNIKEALVAHLRVEVPLVNSRIYFQHWPKDRDPVFPLITYHKISGPRHHDIDVAYPRFQFSCWAEDPSQVEAVAGQVRRALQRYKGIMGSAGGVEGIEIIQGVFMNELDMHDAATGLYQIPVDIKIIYREE